MKTRAALLEKTGQMLRIEELELAPPRHGEVLVRLEAAGICHSDWHVILGDTAHPMPAVTGHEGAGVVESVGQGVTSVKLGDRVVLCWAPHCGKCYYCTHGRKCLCPQYTATRWKGVLMDGEPRLALPGGGPVYHFCALACFADHAVVHESSCVPIRADVDPKVAALVGCAVTTGVGAVVRTARVPPGANVAVVGVGGVGLCTVMGARIARAGRIIAIDREATRCEMAGTLGATDSIVAGDDHTPVVERVHELTDGRGADFVFESVGHPAVQEAALDLVRPGGQVILTGLAPTGSATNLPGAIITRRELTVRGSYYGTADPSRDFTEYIDWHIAGRLPIDRLVSKTYPLDQINEGFADMLEGRTARGVIVW